MSALRLAWVPSEVPENGLFHAAGCGPGEIGPDGVESFVEALLKPFGEPNCNTLNSQKSKETKWLREQPMAAEPLVYFGRQIGSQSFGTTPQMSVLEGVGGEFALLKRREAKSEENQAKNNKSPLQKERASVKYVPTRQSTMSRHITAVSERCVFSRHSSQLILPRCLGTWFPLCLSMVYGKEQSDCFGRAGIRDVAVRGRPSLWGVSALGL